MTLGRKIGGMLFCGAAVTVAQASFHFMQVEQIIGGVNGDATAQAIQLRMRTGGQNQMQLAKLVARDSNGANPVVVIDFANPVPVSTGGARILITSAGFNGLTTPSCTADFTMTNLIPSSYLEAGTLTFEQDSPATIYWRVSWGGGNYAGANTGNTTNDADGNFGPPLSAGLPTSSGQAVQFRFAASALSTSNSNDYQLTTAEATFINNAGGAFVITTTPPPECDGDVNRDLTVDLTDLAIVLANFGIAEGASEAQGDLDEDGDVDLSDLSVLLANFGASCE